MTLALMLSSPALMAANRLGVTFLLMRPLLAFFFARAVAMNGWPRSRIRQVGFHILVDFANKSRLSGA